MHISHVLQMALTVKLSPTENAGATSLGTKRVNFNIDDQCHRLLKSVCALKGLSVSDYCYRLIATEFEKDIYQDERIRDLFMSGSYTVGSNAYELKKRVERELNNE